MITIDPPSAVVTQGQSVVFRALDAGGAAVAAQWRITPAVGAGTIVAATGVYQAPANVAAQTAVTVEATAGADTATASISLVPPALIIEPDHVALHAGQAQTFRSFMPGAPNAPLTWVVSPNAPGWDEASKTLTAPNQIPQKRTHTIKVYCLNPAADTSITVDLVGPKPSAPLVLAVGLYLAAVYFAFLFIIYLWPPASQNTPDLTNLQAERDTLQRTLDDARKTAQTARNQAPATPGPAGTSTAQTSAQPPNGPSAPTKTEPAKATGPTGVADADQKLKDAETALAAKNTEISAALATQAKGPVQTKFGFVDRDIDLMWISILAGALGAFLYGAKSFVSYLGNETFQSSWTAWYLFVPLIGSGLALIFYLIFRGGLLSSASGADVNPFGIAGISGLVGMFTRQATNKLDETFSTLFRSTKDQELKDKLPHDAAQPK